MDLNRYKRSKQKEVKVSADGQTFTLKHPSLENSIAFSARWRAEVQRQVEGGLDEKGKPLDRTGLPDEDGREERGRMIIEMMALALSYTLDHAEASDIDLMTRVVVGTGGTVSPVGDEALLLCGLRFPGAKTKTKRSPKQAAKEAATQTPLS